MKSCFGHFLNHKVKVAQQPLRLYSSWNSPGQNTGMGNCSLVLGIFPIQESNPGLPQILYQLSHQGSPKDMFSNHVLQLETWEPRKEVLNNLKEYGFNSLQIWVQIWNPLSLWLWRNDWTSSSLCFLIQK